MLWLHGLGSDGAASSAWAFVGDKRYKLSTVGGKSPTGAEAAGPSPASPPPLLGRMPLAQMAEETSGILQLVAL